MTLARRAIISRTAMGLVLSLSATPLMAQTETIPDTATDEPIILDEIVLSAGEQVLQALGVTEITEEEIQRQPITNDISEIVRKQPGVNLTGATASGQRGNQRQIDIRGMGPENTLILIDGKPVLSRNSVRMSRNGERDTRGDSNWVPAEMIERIEVLRGPAAARYGSGSSGGVVNIITKRPETLTGQVGLYYNSPEGSDEGDTIRTNFMLGGPVSENLSFRIFGNHNKSNPDSSTINRIQQTDDDGELVFDADGNPVYRNLAGREGVINKDLGSLLSWRVNDNHQLDFEFNFSRQGNRFAGDTMFGSVLEEVDGQVLLNTETNRMYRRTLGVTHRGEYDFGDSFSYIQWENTRNARLCEGTGGRIEGQISACNDDEGTDVGFRTTKLDNITAKTEWNLPMDVAGRGSVITLGAEYRGEFLDDSVSTRRNLPEDIAEDAGVAADGTSRDPKVKQNTIGLYAEANIEWSDQLTLTPAIRYDYNDNFGGGLSPSLNVTYQITNEWTVKAGVARAFKAPNLYQLNPGYVYSTNGNGCPFPYYRMGPCYIIGNPDLEAETSINKEIGIAYNGLNEVNASLTYFHNDYDNRIATGLTQLNGDQEPRLYRWENRGDAVVSGIEGNFATPIGDRFAFNANFTSILKTEDEMGLPLSLVPDYTINAGLDWFVTQDATLTLSATHFGKINPATASNTTGYDIENPETRPSYTLVNLAANWNLQGQTRLSAGITNLFDKSILRTNTSDGANTFNEPGRAFYVSLNKSF
ncbi:MAG: FepA family TonB-dependent siderophore receptor [Paracoccus sp. (in: a-proteobacteria)]|uniref:FepA family TonB-dependent siderophore receptor n=1 Tax=Paracoccus sp. TaxID=267 RepID=UPI0026E03C3D|nr:FepA family TonB-dependent siderophore receptor [Paracoccus sp. (in: a-proteobacteria)]MDO5622749.1 FepA family TonB-dependent siderophore receptor [Paracoccus sp. (in: a-proteobacteria)]